MLTLWEKNSLCVAVMIFNIYLQVNNEYSDSAIDYTCTNTKSEWITIILFLLTVFSVFIYNENMHQFLTNLLWASKQLKEIIWVKAPLYICTLVGNNTKMTQLGFETELVFLVWKWNQGIISQCSLKVGHQNGRK